MQPNRAGDGRSGGGGVAGDHDNAHAETEQFRQQGLGISPRRIAEGDQAKHLHGIGGSGGNGKGAVAGGGECVQARHPRRGHRGHRGDRLRRTLDHAQQAAGGILDVGFSHLGSGVERDEADDIRQRAEGCGADRCIDRVLAVGGAGGGGQAQDFGGYQAGLQRGDGSERQRVLGQRAGFVGANNVNHRRFIQRRQPGQQHTLVGQQPGANGRG